MTTNRERSARPHTAMTSRAGATKHGAASPGMTDIDVSHCDVIVPTVNDAPYRLRLTKSDLANNGRVSRSRPATPAATVSVSPHQRALTAAAIGHPRSRDTVFPMNIVNSITKEHRVNQVELQFVAGFVNVVKPPVNRPTTTTTTMTGSSLRQKSPFSRRPNTTATARGEHADRQGQGRLEQDTARSQSTSSPSTRLPVVIINSRQSRDHLHDVRVTCNTPDVLFTDWLAGHPLTESRTTSHSALSGSLQSLDNCNQEIYHLYGPQVTRRHTALPLPSDVVASMLYRQYTDIPGQPTTFDTSRLRRLLQPPGECVTAGYRSNSARLRKPQIHGKGIRFMGKFLGARAPLKSAANSREADMVRERCPFICVNKSVPLLLR